MDNDKLNIFKNDEFGSFRMFVDESGEPWFVGNDIAKCLGYENLKNAVKKHVEEEDSMVIKPDCKSGGFDLDPTEYKYVSELRLINESGLYSLIFASKMKKAKEFKRWVTSEVLPSIRKTGMYKKNESVISLPNFEDPAEAAEAWAKEYRGRVAAEKLALEEHSRAEQEKLEKETAVNTLIEKQEDLEFAESFIDPGENDMLVREVAKKLEQNNIIIAEKNLRKFMQEVGFFTKREHDGQYELSAKVVKKGYAFYRPFFLDKYSGERVNKQTVYITGLGYREIAKAIKTKCKNTFFKYGKFSETYF